MSAPLLRSFRAPLTRSTRPFQLSQQRNGHTSSPLLLLRSLTPLTPLRPSSPTGMGLITQQQTRHYASANKKGKVKATASIIPGSQQPIVDEAAKQEYSRADATMKAAVDWFKKECSASEARAAGRVTPALLDPVRVKIPGNPTPMRLDELSTVGVREGSTLLITLFDEHSAKHVESALYDSNIPGVVPHRQDNRTIKVPIPKPTVEARTALFTVAKRKAEEIRQQIRKQHSTSLKRGKYEKHSVELEEFQKLTDRHIKEVDTILANLQKATGAK